MNKRFFKLITLSAVVLVFAYTANAKFGQQVKAPKSDNKTIYAEPNGVPHIKFDNLVHDFCEVAPDSTNNCSFKFTNTGTGKLIVTETRGTCKCTVPELAKKDYNPGESGEITVSFHAPLYAGPTSQNVHVASNDPENPRAELTIRADVVSKVRVNPDVMNLSLIDSNNAGAVPITVKSVDDQNFSITSISSEGNVFSVPFDPNKKSDTFVLYPKVNMENLKRYLAGNLVINVDHPQTKYVRVQYNCLKEFEASPAVIIIRDANVGQVQERSIYVVSNYNEPINIESITSDKNIIKAVKKIQTTNRCQIDTEITPPPREGQNRVFSDNLHIKIKDKEDIAIACRGFYRPGP